jgi:hypothetical protein
MNVQSGTILLGAPVLHSYSSVSIMTRQSGFDSQRTFTFTNILRSALEPTYPSSQQVLRVPSLSVGHKADRSST